MNIVMSLWTKPLRCGNSIGYNNVKEMMESLVVSANVAKKNYNEIHFYTDKYGEELIQPYLKYLPFTKIEVCLDELEWLNEEYWSLSKLYVYKLQKEPFIHIDNDVFLWDVIPNRFLERDMFFQEIESFEHEFFRNFYLKGIELYDKDIPKEITISDGAFNCGVFACCNEKSLELMQKYYKISKNFILKLKSYKSNTYDDGANRGLATVVLEQLFIYSLVKSNNINFDVFLYPNKIDFKYSHFLSHNKRNPKIVRRIREIFEGDIKEGKPINI
jgi:hypothetical protein